ncbi:MAG: hypothetical protein ACHQSE_02695 [Gemmatimonadales bacterium]
MRWPLDVLSTAERNEPAQRLFARAGFRRTMIEMSLKIDGHRANGLSARMCTIRGAMH